MKFFPLLVSLLMLIGPLTVSAQFSLSNFSVKPFLGAGASYPFGQSIKDLRAIETELESISTAESSFSGRRIPSPSIHGGFELSYDLLDKLTVGLGLQWMQNGHQYQEIFRFNDESFQYDAEQKGTTTYRFVTTQLPLSATWLFSENWHLTGGFSMAWISSGKSARYIYESEFNVTINGEKDEEESEAIEKEEFELASSLKKNVPGVFVGLRFPLPKTLRGYLDVHQTANVFAGEETNIRYLSARLGVIYPIQF